MSVYLIGNKAERDSNSLYVSDTGSTNFTPSDAVNMTRGPRHVKTKTDAADRAVIYRNNSGNLNADCCVIAGASRMLGHRMQIKSFSDCNGLYNGGTSSSEHVWDGNDFGRGLARSFVAASSMHYSLLDAAQSGLDFTNPMWASASVRLADVSTADYTIFSKYTTAGNQRSYRLVYEHTGNRFIWVVSRDGTSGTLSQVTANTFGALSANTWYHVFCGYDGTNIFLGVNGGAFNTSAHATTIFSGSAAVNIGAERAGALNFANGRISHVCCGNSLALGARAIQSYCYNGGNGRTWYDWSDNVKTKVGLVSHWSLKASSGSSTEFDDYGPNTLTGVNSPNTAAGPFAYPEAIEERYGSTSKIVGPPDRTKKPQDLVHFFSSAKNSQEGFGILNGAGDGGAYEEQVPAAYFDTAMELTNPLWPVVERPAYGVVKKERQYFKTERAAQLTIPFLTRSQVEQIKAMDLDEPIFVYDSEGSHLHDKLWHCIATVSDVAEFDDQYRVTLDLQRLRHYEVR